MRKICLVLVLLKLQLAVFSQNVGIGTNAPTGRLQINHRSGLISGLSLIDSTTQGLGKVEFRNVNNTSRILLEGFAQNNFNNGQYLDIKTDSAVIATFKGDGLVGIRNLNPVYPIDVSGNVNTTGALRVNGNAGNNGQVLRSNGNGTMQWDDQCAYNNFVTLRSIIANTWTIPAGVTKILVESWGAGGGGNILAGGGAGGYVKAHFTVTSGDIINYITGDGGSGASLVTATIGTVTTCTVGTVTVTAGGGQGALYLSASNGQGGVGGTYSVTGTFANYIGLYGGSGKSQERSYYPYNATTYYETGKAGRGGDAPNLPESGGCRTIVYL